MLVFIVSVLASCKTSAPSIMSLAEYKGSKLAAISVNQDTSIYVYNFVSQQWARFQLYNPTKGQGVNIAGVRYAEALEWDYTGEYLVYDAYNLIPNTAEYWDVGFIRVWNNAANTWGDGTINKLFTGLPAGISIGNPSISKNSPNILAFDYYDANTNVFSVLGANIETGDVGTIWEQAVIGTPSYSRTDDRMVFNGRDANNTMDVIGIVTLNTNKITPTGTPAIFLEQAIWPVWFASGQRDTRVGIDDVVANSWTVAAYPNPFASVININLNVLETTNAEYSVQLYNLIGQLVYETSTQPVTSSHTVAIPSQDLPAGYYLVKVGNGKEFKTLKVVKQ